MKDDDNDTRAYYKKYFEKGTCGLFIPAKREFTNIARPYFNKDLIMLEKTASRMTIFHEYMHLLISQTVAQSGVDCPKNFMSAQEETDFKEQRNKYLESLVKLSGNNDKLNTAGFLLDYIAFMPGYTDFLTSFPGEEVDVTINLQSFADDLKLSPLEKIVNLKYMYDNYQLMTELNALYGPKIVGLVDQISTGLRDSGKSLDSVKKYEATLATRAHD